MNLRAVATSCAVLLAITSAAHAANLEITQGEVLRSHGGGFEALKGASELSIGDTVIGQPGSVAKITYADGCSVPLAVGTVFRIGKLSPCTPHSAGAGASGVTRDPGDDDSRGYGDWRENWRAYALGAAGIGGIVAIAVSASRGGGHHNDDDETPASP